MKKLARRDKRQWVTNLSQEAETAAVQGNSRQLYKITRQLANKNFANNCSTVKDKNGENLTSTTDQINRWYEHFNTSLSTLPDGNEDISESPNPSNDARIPTTEPSYEEVKKAIKLLKCNKAAGPDNIPPELLVHCPDIVETVIYPLIINVWQQEKLPDDWKEGLIVKLPKKGDLTLCKNWRGITLLNVINKLVGTILHTRLADTLEPTLRREQAGFRPHRSTIDHINTLRLIVEQSQEFQTSLALCFVDFERAFDTLHQEAVWKILQNRGVPAKIVNLIKEMYRGANCRVMHKGNISKEIAVRNGVKQGCVLSPLLFNICLDHVMKKINDTASGIRWGMVSRLGDLEYADDICLISQSVRAMAHKLTRLSDEAEKIGLKINIQKTKEMRMRIQDDRELRLKNTVIEQVQEFTYLGSIIDETGGTEADVRARINKARRAFGMLNNIWKSGSYSREVKLRIFNTNVKSVLLYGSESWKITKNIASQLQTFINNCLRKILRIFWPNRITNEELWSRTGQEKIEIEIRRRKWGWIGHTLRKPSNHVARQALDWNPQGQRTRGRPKSTWRRTITQETNALNKTWNEIKPIAKDRTRWRTLVEALCSS